jgi:hypothetical protein
MIYASAVCDEMDCPDLATSIHYFFFLDLFNVLKLVYFIYKDYCSYSY